MIYSMCQLLLRKKSPAHPDGTQISCGKDGSKEGIGGVSMNLSQRLVPGAASREPVVACMMLWLK